MQQTKNSMTDNAKAEKLAHQCNVSFCSKTHRERKRYYVHGHSSTISNTKLQAITKYLQ